MKQKGFKRLYIVLAVLLLVSAAPVFAGDSASFSGEIVIAHTTDTHGYAYSDSGSYGYGKLAAILKNIREENANSLLLDSGDFYEGQAFSNLEKGESISPIISQIGYDAMTTGNHEYSYGAGALKELTAKAGVPVLAANVYNEDGALAFDDCLIRDFGDFQVGIFGLAHDDTPNQTIAAGTQGLVFRDCTETAKRMVTTLKRQGADYIIALTHLGSAETEDFKSIELAKAVEGLDLVLDGHSHVVNGGTYYGDTLLVASGYYTKNIGTVTLTVEKGEVTGESVKILSADTDYKEIPADPAVAKIVSDYQTKQAAFFENEIGQTRLFWNGEKYIVRGRETALSRLITESYLEETGADVAFSNGGGIRSSIEPVSVSLGDVFNTQPFGNYLLTKEVKGADILSLLETHFSGTSGEYLHVAGVDVTYDRGKPVGERVVSCILEETGKPIDPEAAYTVGTSNYIATHAEFPSLSKAAEVNQFGPDYEATADYIQAHGMNSVLERNYIEVNGKYPGSGAIDLIRNSWPVEADVIPVSGGEDCWLLPFRALMETEGYTVTYDGASRSARAEKEGAPSVRVLLDSGMVSVGNAKATYKVDLVSGRTMVCEEFFESLLDCTLYDDSNYANCLVLY